MVSCSHSLPAASRRDLHVQGVGELVDEVGLGAGGSITARMGTGKEGDRQGWRQAGAVSKAGSPYVVLLG